MHKSCLNKIDWFFDVYYDHFPKSEDGKVYVLDVGGEDINGDYFLDEKKYVRRNLNIDIATKPDVLVKNPYNWSEVEDNSYDVVVSFNTFQHVEFFWETIKEMKRVVKANGILAIIAPSNRYDGKYPVACYSFNCDGFIAISKWANLEVIDVSIGGVPNKYADSSWDSPHDDLMLIAKKGDKRGCESYPRLGYSRRYRGPYELLMDFIELDNESFYGIFRRLKIEEFYIYGCGRIGKIFYKRFGVGGKAIGFVDPYVGSSYCNLNVKAISDCDKNRPIIIAVFHDYDVINKITIYLKDEGFTKIYSLGSIIRELKDN